MEASKPVEAVSIRGSELTHRGCKVSQITQWLEVTPLEMKLSIEMQLAQGLAKFDYEKENQCSLCYCALFDEPDIQTATIADLVKIQEQVFQAKLSGDHSKGDLQVVKMSKCLGVHMFHKECLENQLNSTESKEFIKCAICGITYGIQTGDMPPGQMTWSSTHFRSNPIEGFTEKNSPVTISISYSLPSGQKNGVRYTGTRRNAYLPGNAEGVLVLSMLVEAFKRKLIFKVGTSITTGQENQTVWQGIHHKTSPSGGTSSFGFPDPTYFQRVTEELASRGITPEQTQLVDQRGGSINSN